MEQTNTPNQESKCCVHPEMPCKKIMGILVGLFLIVLIAYFFVGMQNKIKEGRYIGQELDFKNTITVSDSAEVYAKPDLAVTTASVVSRAQTVAAAFKDNATKMNAIIETVKKQGVEEKDLKTTAFNIYPQYEYPAPSYKRIFIGYEVRQSLLIKIRNLENVGQIIESMTTVGANEMSDLQFTIDDPGELRKQAREEAINKAKKKAYELASQLGVRLVRISGFSEGSSVPGVYALDKAYALGGGEEMAAPQIQTGENKIEVNVNITYEIN